jgi:hypothetical protein
MITRYNHSYDEGTGMEQCDDGEYVMVSDLLEALQEKDHALVDRPANKKTYVQIILKDVNGNVIGGSVAAKSGEWKFETPLVFVSSVSVNFGEYEGELQ